VEVKGLADVAGCIDGFIDSGQTFLKEPRILTFATELTAAPTPQ
jgi:hypothetical protein